MILGKSNCLFKKKERKGRMSTLTLKDGTVLTVLETSTPSSINMRGDFATISAAMSAISTDNLKNAKLGDTVLVNKVYTGFNGSRDGDDFLISFNLRDKTDVEILYEMADETQQAIMELAQG